MNELAKVISEKKGRILVFCEHMGEVGRTAEGLDRMHRFSVDYLVSPDNQGRREKTFAAFLSGKIQVLITTFELAGRSHTFVDLEMLIFYQQPKSLVDYERYLARIGTLGAPGTSIMFRIRDTDPPAGDWATFLAPHDLPSCLENAPDYEESYEDVSW